MLLGYQAPDDITDSLETLDRLNEKVLCIVLERDGDILATEAQVTGNYRNIDVRFIRIFSKNFKAYATLEHNTRVLTEDDLDNNILRFIAKFVVNINLSTLNAYSGENSVQQIEMITSQEMIVRPEELLDLPSVFTRNRQTVEDKQF